MNYHVLTYGCQMNELDSQFIEGLMQKKGYNRSNEQSADIIIFNTCSVRDLAERKVLGKIGILSRKKTRPIIGVCGCMSMTKKENLLKKFDFIDFVLGTKDLNHLEEAIDKAIDNNKTLKVDGQTNDLDYSIAKRSSNIKAYVSIMQGCNNFCSYCIVPYTRGREISKDYKKIISECQGLVNKGYKEIILLGQNVNSYKSGDFLFTDLLYELDKIVGLKRIRFLTSHPKDITLNLMQAIKDLDSICKFVHFPAQSGSSEILKKMNRQYTIEQYLEKIDMLKRLVPNISFGTDIIVGFPEETEIDFQKTLDLFEKVRFSTAFIYAYSPRKNTLSYTWKDDVSKEKKHQRLQTLMQLYHKIQTEDNKKMLGSKIEVLLERLNKDKVYLKGKTTCNKSVIIQADKSLIGTIQKATLVDYKNQTFTGQL